MSSAMAGLLVQPALQSSTFAALPSLSYSNASRQRLSFSLRSPPSSAFSEDSILPGNQVSEIYGCFD